MSLLARVRADRNHRRCDREHRRSSLVFQLRNLCGRLRAWREHRVSVANLVDGNPVAVRYVDGIAPRCRNCGTAPAERSRRDASRTDDKNPQCGDARHRRKPRNGFPESDGVLRRCMGSAEPSCSVCTNGIERNRRCRTSLTDVDCSNVDGWLTAHRLRDRICTRRILHVDGVRRWHVDDDERNRDGPRQRSHVSVPSSRSVVRRCG